MLIGRVATGLAAAALLVVLMLAVLPNPGTAVVYPPTPRHVNCGTMFVPTTWSGDDGCEHLVISRFLWSFVLWVAALVLGTIGLVLLHRDVRYG